MCSLPALRDGLSDVTLDTTGTSESDRICLVTSGSGESGSDTTHSKSKDLRDYGVNDESVSGTMNHDSEAQLRRQDTVLITDRTDLSELSFRSNSHDDQPVLQTPDDFASPR